MPLKALMPLAILLMNDKKIAVKRIAYAEGKSLCEIKRA